MDPEQKKYYPFLDGFRALAILWVLAHHIYYTFHPVFPFSKPAVDILHRFAYLGLLGVDIFFVISGFLISGLLFEDLPGKVRVSRFYFRRFFKIVPQYISVVFVGILLTLLFGQAKSDFLFSISSYLFLFQNYVQPIGLLAHLWSIAVEEHFYLIYPLLLQGIFMLGRTIEQKRRLLLGTFCALMVLVFFVRRFTFIHYPYNQLLLFQMSHLRIDSLLCGCVIKLLEPSLRGAFFTRSKFFAWACFLISGGLFYKIFLCFDPCRSTSYVYVYLASGFLLVSALCGFRPLLALTENRLARWIGRHSYGIYIWHYPLIFVVHRIVHGQTNWLIMVLTFLLAILAGVLSTETIEKHFLNLRKKIVP